MFVLYYDILFACSILFLMTYVFMWHKHFDITFTVVFTLIPLSCLGYAMFYHSENIQEAILTTKILYLGGSFLQYFLMLSIFNLCKIKVKKWLRKTLFFLCMSLYGFVLSIGRHPWFYKDISFHMEDGIPVLQRNYGIVHTLFYFTLGAFFSISLIAIIYSYFKKKQVSRKVIHLLFLPDVISILSYVAGRSIDHRMEFVPLAYIFAEVIYLLIAYRVNLYDISDTVIDSLVQNGDTGFISYDFKLRYLGSNETAKKLLPELSDLPVDSILGKKTAGERKMRHWLESFAENEEQSEFVFQTYYRVNVNYLYDGKRRRGYMITLTDDTQNKKYIELLDNYNEKLKEEVEEKTRHIEEMHDNLIMSLAAMVESRDNSTGGHIKRTSEGVRILLEQIKKDDTFHLSEEFCKNMIKAAPMHDLGKIAVDDAVLRKPGRFTEEEFAKMKHHAAEGARVIHEILEKTEDENFKVLAENVAHYHHERWDGSGYPEGLKGEAIPLEARIMAIADVYDALVSKRVYKESMSFEKADSIIMEGMGTQFDPSLKKYYVNARESLERYYSQL